MLDERPPFPRPALHRRARLWLATCFAATCFLATAIACSPGSDNDPGPLDSATTTALDAPAESLRVAVFNIWELSTEKLDAGAPQVRAAAEVLQRVRPDIVLINEIDGDPEVARRFRDEWLAVSQDAVSQGDGEPGALEPLDYPYVVSEPVNTGVQSGFDFDGDGEPGGPEDAWGFGRYPGQYGMALYSRFPVDRDSLRTFRLLRWSTLPGHLLPDGRDSRPAWYDEEEAEAFRLSSKSHWDVPVRVEHAGETHTLHLLASHPTPPVFDGEEDRNGRRNFDEIRLWADYLAGGEAAEYIVDDQGRAGGLDSDASFVILGDLNADPLRSDAPYGQPAIRQLLDHPRVQDPEPRGAGERVPRDGDEPYPGDAATLTSGFGRIDYALPSRDLRVLDSGVFWPVEGDPARALVEGDERASDHQLVWVDLAWPPTED